MATTYDKLVAFIAVVENGGFTQAAEVLDRTQSSISRMVSSLEEGWGVRLFVRNGPNVAITPDGERLLVHARKAVEDFDTMERYAASVSSVESGSLRVAAPSSIASRRLAGPIGLFLRDHPAVNVTLIESTYEHGERLILADEADIAFLNRQLEGDKFTSTLFDRDELVAVSPAGYFPKGAVIGVPELLKSPFVGDSETAPRLLERHSSLMVRCVTSDIEVILAMVESGLGISLLPSRTLERKDYAVDVHKLREPSYRNIYLVRRKRMQVSLAAQEFIECMKRYDGVK